MQLANKSLKLHKSLNTVIKLMTRKITQPNLYKQKIQHLCSKTKILGKVSTIYALAEIRKTNKQTKKQFWKLYLLFWVQFLRLKKTKKKKKKKTTRTHNSCFRE